MREICVSLPDNGWSGRDRDTHGREKERDRGRKHDKNYKFLRKKNGILRKRIQTRKHFKTTHEKYLV